MVEKIKSTKTVNKTVMEEVQIDAFVCGSCRREFEFENSAEQCEERHTWIGNTESKVKEVEQRTIFTITCGSCKKDWEEIAQGRYGDLYSDHPYECPHCKVRASVSEEDCCASEWLD